jgi:hypothetical protein
MTQEKATAELQHILPYADATAQATVSRYELAGQGGIGHKNPLMVIALAAIYHTPIAAIDPAALDFMNAVEVLINRVRTAGLDQQADPIPTDYDVFFGSAGEGDGGLTGGSTIRDEPCLPLGLLTARSFAQAS